MANITETGPQGVRASLLAPLTAVRQGLSWLSFPVWASALVFGVLLIVAPPQAADSAEFTLLALWNIAPFLLLSVATAAALKASGADQLVARAFQGRTLEAIILASIFGALSPFCSCGVVPLVAGLLAAGVPIAPVMAFCLASPIMDPEMFILTAAGIGAEFAVVKTVAAMGMGMFAGLATLAVTQTGALKDSLKAIARPSCGPTSCGPASCSTGAGQTDTNETTGPVWQFWRHAERRDTFLRESGRAGWFLGRWLTFAFLLESLMMAYVPDTMVATWLGDDNPLALPFAVLLGVPAYLNGYAAIPLVGGLIDLGMSPATGMAFMLAGSVTSIPAAIAVWSLAKPRLFGLYLFLAGSGALLSGFAYQGYLAVL